MGLYEKLTAIQSELNAPKSKFNKFGNYYYRSAEDILEGVKPLLKKANASLFLTDEIVQIGERFYVKATATFIDGETGEKFENSALAREPLEVKGMSAPQVTGASSTYARKYALNGMFCIDDTVDDDTEELKNEKDNRIKEQNKKAKKTDEQKNQEMINSTDKSMIPQNGAITEEHKAKIKAEMERTGIDGKVILPMYKADSIESLTDVQAVAILNRFSKTPDKKES